MSRYPDPFIHPCPRPFAIEFEAQTLHPLLDTTSTFLNRHLPLSHSLGPLLKLDGLFVAPAPHTPPLWVFAAGEAFATRLALHPQAPSAVYLAACGYRIKPVKVSTLELSTRHLPVYYLAYSHSA